MSAGKRFSLNPLVLRARTEMSLTPLVLSSGRYVGCRFRTITAMLCIAIGCCGCLSETERQEQDLRRQLIQHKEDNIRSIDLRPIFGTQWRKACIQAPYIFQSDFEKSSGEKADGFRGLSDDKYVLWFFYTNGHTKRIEIERIKVMDYLGAGASCTSYQQPYLYLTVINGKKKYFFNEAGDLK